MKTARGFSSLIFLLIVFTLILISLFSSAVVGLLIDETNIILPSASRTHNVQVSNKSLSSDDYRTLKAMMDRCVDIFADPSSSPPSIHHGDELWLGKLSITRCYYFFVHIDLLFRKVGRVTPDHVHKLKKEISNGVEPILHVQPMHLIYTNLNCDDIRTKQHSIGVAGGSTSNREDASVLKPMMENCVKLYFDNADGGADLKEKLELYFCGRFFNALGCAYGYKDKLAPKRVAVLKESRLFYKLRVKDRGFQTCLIWEKYGDRNCDGVRANRISRRKRLASRKKEQKLLRE